MDRVEFSAWIESKRPGLLDEWENLARAADTVSLTTYGDFLNFVAREFDADPFNENDIDEEDWIKNFVYWVDKPGVEYMPATDCSEAW